MDGWGGHKATTVLDSLEMSSDSLRVVTLESAYTILELYYVTWIRVL